MSYSLSKSQTQYFADEWIEEFLAIPTSQESHHKSFSHSFNQSFNQPSKQSGDEPVVLKNQNLEEIHFKNPESNEEFTVVTDFRKEEQPVPSFQKMSSFTATWPHAEPNQTHAFFGRLDLSLIFDEAVQKGKKKFDYSPSLNKLFVDINYCFPISFTLKDKSVSSLPPGLFIRATPAFVEPEYRDLDVKVCPIHKTDQNPSLILACKNKNAKYCAKESEVSHHSLVIPFDGKATTEYFQFLCYSSCNELKRRKLEVIFTLEVENRVIGGTSVEVKICSYPIRDRKIEEDSKSKTIEPPKGKKGKKTATPKTKAKSKLSIESTEDSPPAEPIAEQKESSPSEVESQISIRQPSPQGSVKSDQSDYQNQNQFYNLKIQGYENYRIVCKILQGLEAIKALGQEINSSYNAVKDEPEPKRLLDEPNSDKTPKKVKLNEGEGDTLSTLGSQSSSSERELIPLNDKEVKLSKWLQELNLSHYLPNFLQNGYDDLEVIKELDISDFEHLGITLSGHRKKLLLAARKLKRSNLFLNPIERSPQISPTNGAVVEQIEQIEQFEKRTIMRRYHSNIQ